jgi:D-arabinose 1-dehydrogenase-like Zn-dependent alcohol dehydrogenase
MRAAELLDFASVERFGLKDMPIPTAAQGEFLVKVSACGICGHDVLARNGKLKASKGHVIGHEISGTVVKAGSDELISWVGKRVALVQRRPCGKCADCAQGLQTHCRKGLGFYGDDIQGGYAEYVLADPLNTAILPDSIDDRTGSILSCAIGTGIRAIKAAALNESDVILITGAGGGVGIHAVEIAASKNLKVIAQTSSKSKVEMLLEAGATKVLVNPSPEEIRKAAKSLGRDRGVDAVLELTGTPTFQSSLRSMRPRGKLVLVGNTIPEEIGVSLGLIILKELQIIGSANADLKDLVEAIGLVQSGAVKPIVSNTYQLEDVNQAHLDLDSRSFAGRLVITVKP